MIRRRAAAGGLAGLTSRLCAAAWLGLPGLGMAQAQPVAADALLPAVASADTAPADAAGWSLAVLHQRHADALPLRWLDRDDAWAALSPRSGRNLAYLDDRLVLTRRQAWPGAGGGEGLAGGAQWHVSLLARQWATVVANRDALDLAVAVEAGQTPGTSRRWDTAARLRGFAGAGLAAGGTHVLSPGLQFGWQTQLLALGRWQQRSISGPVSYDAGSGQYALALQAQQADNRLDFPFQQAFARRGLGLLFDAELRWQHGPWQLGAGVYDGGWLRWRGLPQQVQRANTDRQGVDAQGFLVYEPLIQGQNEQTGLTQSQPWRARLSLDRTLDGGQQVGVRLDTIPGFGMLPTLRWQSAPQPGAWRFGAEWRVHERRLGAWLQWRGLSLRAGFDRLGSQARSRELGLAWMLPL